MNATTDQSASPLGITFLVLRCQTGDEGAFHQLYRQFSGNTLRYLQSLVGPDFAPDVQQEAWISVLRRIKGLENPNRFKPWLYRVVRHAGIDHLRVAQRTDRLFEHQHDDEDQWPPRTSESVDEILDPEAITRAISRLSAAHQEVVVLRYWEEFSYAEIALLTGIPLGSVRSRLHHAKAHLKKLFENEIDPY